MNQQSNPLKVAQRQLTVMGQALDADWFNGRVHRRFNLFDQWKADVWIHDSGHAVIFSNRNTAITEILASQDLQIPTDRIIWQRIPVEEDFATIQPGGSLEYQLNYELEITDRSIFRYLNQELITKPNASNDLLWKSHNSNRLDVFPVVRIHAEASSRYLSIQSYHTFPDELSILRTQSLFELHL